MRLLYCFSFQRAAFVSCFGVKGRFKICPYSYISNFPLFFSPP